MINVSNVTGWRTYSSRESDYETLYTIALFLIGIIIILVNVMVITLYCWKKRKLLTIIPNRLLLSLSICELLTGTSVVMSAICYIDPDMIDPNTTAIITYRILIDIYTTFLVQTVVMHLCGITLDRYLSLYYALRYQTIVTKNSISIFIVISWFVPLVASTIQLSWLHRVMNDKDTDEYRDIEIWYSAASFMIFLALPMIILGLLFTKMFFEIRRLLRCTPSHHFIELSPRQRRIIYIFCSMYMSFLVLAMPYFSLRLWIDICSWYRDIEDTDTLVWIVRIAILFKNITSIVNPLLYTTTSPELQNLVTKARRRFSVSYTLSAENLRKFSTDVFRKNLLSSRGNRRAPRRKVGRTEMYAVQILLNDVTNEFLI